MEHGLLHATHSSLVLLLRIRTLAGEGGGAVAAVAAVSQQGLELNEIKQGLRLGKEYWPCLTTRHFTAADGNKKLQAEK